MSHPSDGEVQPDHRTALLDAVRARDLEMRSRALSVGAPAAFESDLTLQQLRVLLHVARHDGLTTNGLRDQLGVTAPTASGLVDRLVDQGLVERRPDEHDRRVRHLVLTEAGLQVVTDLDSMSRSLFDQIASVMSDAELRATVATYDLFLGAMDRIGIPHGPR